MRDEKTGESTGVAVASMLTEKDAERLYLKLSGVEVLGHTLSTEWPYPSNRKRQKTC